MGTALALFVAAAGGFAGVALASFARAWLRLRRAQGRLEAVLETPAAVDGSTAADGPLGEASYLLYDLERNVDLRLPLRQDFVVYGFPKTGNSTLAATIGALDVCDFLMGGHHLSARGVADLHRAVAHLLDPALRARQLAYYYACAKFGAILRARAALGGRRHSLGPASLPPFVFTSVRDPVEIFLSGACFVHACLAEKAFELAPEILREAALARAELRGDAARLRDLWFKVICGRIDDGSPWHRETDRWFECELSEVFGLDPFVEPFPHERGWKAIESESARCLLLRQENFASLGSILEGYLGLPPGCVRVVSENRAEQRPDAPLYRELMSRFRLPGELLEEIYASRSVRHFYSPAEIERMKQRWIE